MNRDLTSVNAIVAIIILKWKGFSFCFPFVALELSILLLRFSYKSLLVLMKKPVLLVAKTSLIHDTKHHRNVGKEFRKLPTATPFKKL